MADIQLKIEGIDMGAHSVGLSPQESVVDYIFGRTNDNFMVTNQKVGCADLPHGSGHYRNKVFSVQGEAKDFRAHLYAKLPGGMASNLQYDDFALSIDGGGQILLSFGPNCNIGLNPEELLALQSLFKSVQETLDDIKKEIEKPPE